MATKKNSKNTETSTSPNKVKNNSATKEKKGPLNNNSKSLVVVGSSAGGVAALSVLVNTLDRDFPAPIVLAQHLDPQRASHLASILERQSKLPVVTPDESGPTPMEPGTVYVVPANRHVMIQDSTIRLEGQGDGRPIPSVDRLLSSAAKAYGEHLIAVILTGSGSDGAAGAVDVKEAGGVVIIQNPRTAPYPSMPQSLPPTVVDHVLEIEQIGPLVSDLLKSGDGLIPEKVEDPLRDVLTFVSQKANIDFRNYKQSTILRRLSRRMAVTHLQNLNDYTQYVRLHPEEVAELVKSFLINVTGFFRDREAFDFLRDSVIADLIERQRANGRTIRAWSAGCSTGEEAYSLALVIADLLGPEIPDWNIKIFATDLDDEAVGFARRGFYPAKLLSDLPETFAERYFERIDHGFRVSKSIRQLVIFGSQDLTRGVPFPRMDLVVCRNLLIYLKQDLQQDILDLFAYSLHSTHGYLFLGKAETARPTKASFELINKKWKVYKCTSGPMALPASPPRNTNMRAQAEWAAVRHRADDIEANASLQPAAVGETDLTPLRRINEIIFRYLPVGIAVVDRNYRIKTINGAARRLLGIRELAIDQDFLHTARVLPYAQVRQAIDSAFQDHSTVTLPDVDSDVSMGRYLSLTIMPAHIEDTAVHWAVVTIADVTDGVINKKRLEEIQIEQTRTLEELGNSNKRLTSMNTELQEANEELQSANEELMLTQEELQATNEEFEATNEELQATNEELQTTNDELTARSSELHETARQLSGAREHLDHVVRQFPYYVLIARGPKLNIEAYSARYALLFGDGDAKGEPMEKVFSGDGLEDLIAAARETLKTGNTVTTRRMAAHVAKDDDVGSEFVHVVVAAKDAHGKPDGVIIFTQNVTENSNPK